MRTIWKYPIQPHITLEVDVSEQSRVVLVGRDPESKEVAIWIETDRDKPQKQRRFRTVGTGRDVPINSRHVGSVVAMPYVWHVYELPEPS